METTHSLRRKPSSFLLWRDDSTCRVIGRNEPERRDLMRMLVNSLVWPVISVAIVIGAA